MHSVSNGAAARRIPRRSKLRYASFTSEYLFPNQPVIIEDSLRQWNAVNRWDPEFFQRRFGERYIPVDDRRVSVAEFVDRVLHANTDQPAPYLKGTGDGNYFVDLFPELAVDILPVPEYLFPNWLCERYLLPPLTRRLNRGPKAEIFFGGLGAGFPYLHWDSLYFHAFNAQVFGEKRWVLYAPDQSELLYPKRNATNQSQVDNAFAPDTTRFPLARRATRYECTLGPGELLFIPAGWWHATHMSGPSISIAFNSANASNWASVRSELVKKANSRNGLFGAALNVYLTAVEHRKTRRDRAVAI